MIIGCEGFRRDSSHNGCADHCANTVPNRVTGLMAGFISSSNITFRFRKSEFVFGVQISINMPDHGSGSFSHSGTRRHHAEVEMVRYAEDSIQKHARKLA